MRVVLQDLKPGQILAEPVLGAGGRQLVPAGAALTEQQLQLLRAWGVDAVEVEQGAPSVDPQRIIAAQRAVAARFRGQPVDHPAVRSLFQTAVARFLRNGD